MYKGIKPLKGAVDGELRVAEAGRGQGVQLEGVEGKTSGINL